MPLLDRASQDYDSREDSEKSGKAEETEVAEAPATFRDLLIPQVVLPLVVFMVQAVIDMGVKVLLPLMFSTSIELGGLGFDPYHIGVIMSVWGIINAIFMITVFGRAIRKFGPRTVHIFCQHRVVSASGLFCPRLWKSGRESLGGDSIAARMSAGKWRVI